MEKHITIKWLEDHILNIDYFNPETANSLTPDVINHIHELVQQHKPKALIFTSSHPRVYCSGGNLKNYAQLTEVQTRVLNQQMRHGLEEFHHLPVHTVAFVGGDCFGGGIEFLSCFDEIYAKPHCLFAFWQKKQALSFGWGGYRRLKHRLPEKLLIQLLQNSEVVLASQAFKMGLIDGVEADLSSIVQRIKKLISTYNFKAIKRLLHEDETQIFEQLWYSKDHQQTLKK